MGAVDGHGSIGIASIAFYFISLPWRSDSFPLTTHFAQGIDHAAHRRFAAQMEDGGVILISTIQFC
jgi:hypothetical protein